MRVDTGRGVTCQHLEVTRGGSGAGHIPAPPSPFTSAPLPRFLFSALFHNLLLLFRLNSQFFV